MQNVHDVWIRTSAGRRLTCGRTRTLLCGTRTQEKDYRTSFPVVLFEQQRAARNKVRRCVSYGSCATEAGGIWVLVCTGFTAGRQVRCYYRDMCHCMPAAWL